MPFSPPVTPKQILIPLAGIVAVILVILASVEIMRPFIEKPEIAGIVKTDPQEKGEVTLPGRGKLPPLHVAAARDPALRDYMTRLGQIPADEIFIDSQNADLIMVSILFRWAGIGEVESGLYGPYIDARIIEFMKAIGSIPDTVLPGQAIDANQAITLNNRWFAIFDYYKNRLLIQLSGKAVYDQKASYDLNGDRIVVTGDISADFVHEFQKELHRTRNSGQAMHGFLDFISATKGFAALNDNEQDLIMSLNAGAAAQ